MGKKARKEREERRDSFAAKRIKQKRKNSLIMGVECVLEYFCLRLIYHRCVISYLMVDQMINFVWFVHNLNKHMKLIFKYI